VFDPRNITTSKIGIVFFDVFAVAVLAPRLAPIVGDLSNQDNPLVVSVLGFLMAIAVLFATIWAIYQIRLPQFSLRATDASAFDVALRIFAWVWLAVVFVGEPAVALSGVTEHRTVDLMTGETQWAIAGLIPQVFGAIILPVSAVISALFTANHFLQQLRERELAEINEADRPRPVDDSVDAEVIFPSGRGKIHESADRTH